MVLCCKMLEFLNGDAQMRDFVEPFRKRYSPQHRVENIYQQIGPLIETFMHYSLFNFNLTNCSSKRITRNLNNRQSWTSVYYFRDTTPWLCFIVITINLLKRWVCGKGMQHSFPNSKIIIQKSVNVIQSTLGLWTPCYCELEPKSRLTSQITH